jgi:hypothetical protein
MGFGLSNLFGSGPSTKHGMSFKRLLRYSLSPIKNLCWFKAVI